MMGTALATNLIEFYLFYELMLIPSWALINSYGYGEREKIALMYLIWTHAGAILLLAGIFMTYVRVGSFEMASLSMLRGDPMAIWIALSMLLGFFVKMAVFGLHIWLPYAHAEAPTPISALLSPVMIGLGAYASIRLVVVPLPEVFGKFSMIIAVLALITIVYGGLMALAQDDIKRLLAYSSISQMGYLLAGIASITVMGEAGAMLHYASHALGKGILFAVAGILICQAHGIRSINKLGGLASKMPITATVFIVGFLTISGMPPTIGFQSKWPIFYGAIEGSMALGLPRLTLAIATLFATIITIAYAFYTIWRVFFLKPLPKHLEDVKEAPPIMIVPLLVLMVLSFILGIYPGVLMDGLNLFFSNQLSV
jgi:NADH-quinone oxidoreductase subunit M